MLSSGEILLLEGAKTGNLEAVKTAVSQRIDLDVVDESERDRNTALHHACHKGHVEVVKVLLEKGADLHKKDSAGHTPLHLAAMYNETSEIATLLVQSGADVNAKNIDGGTPLHFAAYAKKANNIRYLLEVGADFTIKTLRNPGRETAVQFANRTGNSDMAQLITNYAAELNKNPALRQHPQNINNVISVQIQQDIQIPQQVFAQRKLLPDPLPQNLTTFHIAQFISSDVQKTVQFWRSGLKQLGEGNSFVDILEKNVELLKQQAVKKPLTALEFDLTMIQALVSDPQLKSLTPIHLAQFSRLAQQVLQEPLQQAENLAKHLSSAVNPFTQRIEEWSATLKKAEATFGKIVKVGRLPEQWKEAIQQGLPNVFSVATTTLKTINQLSLPQEVKNVLTTAATLTQVAEEAIPVVQRFFEGIHHIAEGSERAEAVVKNLEKQLQEFNPADVMGKFKLEHDLSVARNNLKIQQSAFSNTLNGISQGGQLLGTLISFVNPKLGKQVATVVQAAVTVVDTIGKIAAGTLAGGPVGAAMAIGGAILSIFGLFGGGQSTEDVIQQEIKKLSEHLDQRFDVIEKMLTTIHKDMHSRFNRLEQILGEMNQQLHGRFDRIELMLGTFYKDAMQQFAQLATRMGTLQKTANDILKKANTIENKLEQFQREARMAEYRALKTDAEAFKNTHHNPDEVRRLSFHFVNWACVYSQESVFAGQMTSMDEVLLCQEIFARSIASRINHLAYYAQQYGQISINGQGLVNIHLWADAAGRYMQLINQHPELTPDDAKLKKNVGKIIAAGKELNTLVMSVKTNEKLFQKLLTDYRASLKQFLFTAYDVIFEGIIIDDNAPSLTTEQTINAVNFYEQADGTFIKDLFMWVLQTPQLKDDPFTLPGNPYRPPEDFECFHRNLQGDLPPERRASFERVMTKGAHWNFVNGHTYDPDVNNLRAAVVDRLKIAHDDILKFLDLANRKHTTLMNMNVTLDNKDELREKKVLPLLSKAIIAELKHAKNKGEVLDERLVSQYFSRVERVSLNQRLQAALNTPSIKEAIENLDTAYQLLTIFVTFAFGKDITHDVVLRSLLERGFWNSEDFKYSLEHPGEDFVTVAMQKQALGAIDELENYLLNKIAISQQLKEQKEVVGDVGIERVISELEAFREFYCSAPLHRHLKNPVVQPVKPDPEIDRLLENAGKLYGMIKGDYRELAPNTKASREMRGDLQVAIDAYKNILRRELNSVDKKKVENRLEKLKNPENSSFRPTLYPKQKVVHGQNSPGNNNNQSDSTPKQKFG